MIRDGKLSCYSRKGLVLAVANGPWACYVMADVAFLISEFSNVGGVISSSGEVGLGREDGVAGMGLVGRAVSCSLRDFGRAVQDGADGRRSAFQFAAEFEGAGWRGSFWRSGRDVGFTAGLGGRRNAPERRACERAGVATGLRRVESRGQAMAFWQADNGPWGATIGGAKPLSEHHQQLQRPGVFSDDRFRRQAAGLLRPACCAFARGCGEFAGERVAAGSGEFRSSIRVLVHRHAEAADELVRRGLSVRLVRGGFAATRVAKSPAADSGAALV